MSSYCWFNREHSYRSMRTKIAQASHSRAPGPQNISMENSIKNIILEIVPHGLEKSSSCFQADQANSSAWNIPAQDYWRNSQKTNGEDTGCIVSENTELVLKTLKLHGLQMVRILLAKIYDLITPKSLQPYIVNL